MQFSQKKLLQKLHVPKLDEGTGNEDARYRHGLPAIMSFAMSESKNRDWGTIVTIHDSHAQAYVWKHAHR
jgi:hypothetical protein